MRPTRRHILAALAACALPLAGAATISAASAATAAPPLKVSGDHIVNATTGTTIALHGVNESSWVNACVNGPNFWDGTVAQSAEPATWAGVNMVRIHINEDCWLGINGLPAQYSAASYRSAIETAVADDNAAGLEVDLVLGWNAPGSQQSLGQNTMIDTSHGPAFWASLTSAFGTNRSVIFELFNEPRPAGGADNSTAAACVKNGGPAGPCASFATTGMQAITTQIRNAGAQNVILEGGPHSEQDPKLWSSYKVTDPMGDLAASWHTYPGNSCNVVSCWNSDVKPVANSVPVIASEVGDQVNAGTCTYTYSPKVTSWANGIDSGAVGYEAFVWDPFGGCDNLTTDLGTGSPTSPYGTGWKTELAGAPHAASTPSVQPGGTNIPAPSSPSNHPWISFEAAVNNLYQASHTDATWGWGEAASLVTCASLTPCTPDGLAAAPAYRFTSEATFAAEVGSVPAGAKVVYDIEDGNGTPANESATPDAFMKLFNQVAVAHGLHPVLTPGLDLGNTATDCPKMPGEVNWQWSIRCNLWGHAAAGSKGDVNVVMQGQTITATLSDYDSLFSQGSAECHSWFATCKAGDELSGNYGTAAQQTAAAESIPSTYDMYFSFSASQVPDVQSVFSSLMASGW